MSEPGIRARNRAAIMAAITDSANRQLLEAGPSELSVRAVARELGMASSAIYRYVSSRDELLTLLIVGAFNDMAQSVEARAERMKGARKRWQVIGLASRDWAIEQPQRFALIYGSPVPGYAAPQDTIGPATRIPALLIGILQEAHVQADVSAFDARVARSLRPALANLDQWADLRTREFNDAAFALGVMAWTHIIGSISFELFGHRHNVVGDSQSDRRTYFEFELNVLADLLGIGQGV
ncbi:MAG: TetR/AcrR family transcriptional regulator [Actinobacteria bacterium]|nr:TetR/AcrR family transcriptional regulator [Actinomycetota bacterium]MCB8997950.1 TetR/AcrR family transcriptional regulator [Actinomycetota bacterium]MCB9414453.1 TetR/AcrR family transcriptional regulator [Actinomycetota bacterium]HRY08713.1 TetR/AcrR family transcriptional regulator [Candidatus Nanopelagicales bacterium]